MRYLLDTSVLLWSVEDESKLSKRGRELLSSADSEVYLSSASSWEIAIKYALGTLPLHIAPAVFIPEVMQGMALRPLEINHIHAVEAGRLPLHHRDPFDRMLIAQAQVEGMVLLTGDRVFQKYEVDQVFCGK